MKKNLVPDSRDMMYASDIIARDGPSMKLKN